MKVLIIIDVQYDFLPGGALAILGADAIIPVINQLIPQFEHVVATLDWHTQNHVSFAATHHKKVGEVIHLNGIEQILWPIHCVQNTHGARISNALNQTKIEAIFHKGCDPNVDSYSTFFDNLRKRHTGLGAYLQKHKWNDLYFVGLATDYCVLYSVLDALELGFKATVIRDACRAINLKPDDEKQALEKMKMRGAHIIFSRNIAL